VILATPHTRCRACSAALPAAFLDLGMQPLANNLCTTMDHCDDVFPMRLCRCSICGLLQLDTVIDPAAMFSHYLYTPSQSKKTLAHFEELADEATRRVVGSLEDCPRFAVDIGSNDGALLGMLVKRDWLVCGIDPAENLAQQAHDAGLPTIVGFFDETAVGKIVREYGHADLITANNVFAHTPSWHTFAECASQLLAQTGQLAIEFPYGPTMLRDGTFDLIYWEHASFPSLGPLVHLFGPHGLHVQDVEMLPSVHGGSVRVWLGFEKKATDAVVDMILAEEQSCSLVACRAFGARVAKTIQALRNAVQMERARGQRIVGFTAPAKCVTLLTAAGLGIDDVAFIIDDNPLKQGRMLPKLHIPIVSSADAPLTSSDTVIIFAWNVAEDILAKLPVGVSAIVPMPNVYVITR
jgi:hypothetical protein